jgi:hypothetical protein
LRKSVLNVSSAVVILLTGGMASASAVTAAQVSAQVSAAAATVGVSASGAALTAIMAGDSGFVSDLDSSLKRHPLAVTAVQHRLRALDAIQKGSVAEGISAERALEVLAEELGVLANMGDLPSITTVQGATLRMSGKKKFFADAQTRYSDGVEEKALAAVIALIEGSKVTQAVLGKEMGPLSVEEAMKLYTVFNEQNGAGDVEAALRALEAKYGAEQVADKSGQLAVACGSGR